MGVEVIIIVHNTNDRRIAVFITEGNNYIEGHEDLMREFVERFNGNEHFIT